MTVGPPEKHMTPTAKTGKKSWEGGVSTPLA